LTFSSKTRAVPVAMALAGSLALAACGAANENSTSNASGSGGSNAAASSSAKQLNGTLNGAGSSAQQAAMQAWTANFTSQQPGVTVNYDSIGSGGGRKQFLSSGSDFAGSDAALSSDEIPQAKSRCKGGDYLEIPDYISPIAIVYNLQGVKDLQLTPDTLAKIFKGQITTWNDPAIKADNPNANLPSTKITPVHRSDSSGTTENFTDYLHQVAPSVWTDEKSGDWPVQGGEAGAQTSGLVAAVKAGQGTIGYADQSQAGDLGQAKIKVGNSFVAPSAEGAAKVVANSSQDTSTPGRGQYDYAVNVNRTTTGDGEYPLLLVSYLIGCTNYSSANTGAMLQDFLTYVVSQQGQQAAAQQAGSAPIGDNTRSQDMKAINAITAS
jgi:phosphate transport system substrate-binding protein